MLGTHWRDALGVGVRRQGRVDGLHLGTILFRSADRVPCRVWGEIGRMLRMMTARISRWLVVVGAMGLAGVLGCGPRVASPPAPAGMAPETMAAASGAGLKEIHVDQSCHILQDPVDGVRGVSVPGVEVTPGGQVDNAVCHLESVFRSSHVKETVVGGVAQRSVVVVAEQEYLLQDVLQEPVVFVVEQEVAEGWKVDSDPQPTERVGRTAVFRVVAQPGQIVRLHVGEEHTIPLAGS